MRLCPASMSSSGASRRPASSLRARRGHVGSPPPARVVVHLASLALFITFWLPLAVGHEGEGDDARGHDAGGGDDARGVICCPIISLYYVGRTEEEEEEEEEDNMGSGLFE